MEENVRALAQINDWYQRSNVLLMPYLTAPHLLNSRVPIMHVFMHFKCNYCGLFSCMNDNNSCNNHSWSQKPRSNIGFFCSNTLSNTLGTQKTSENAFASSAWRRLSFPGIDVRNVYWGLLHANQSFDLRQHSHLFSMKPISIMVFLWFDSL